MATNFGQDYCGNLTGLISRCYQEELQRYHTLVTLAESISGQILSAQYDQMTTSMTHQAKLIDEIDRVEAQMEPLKRDLARTLGLPEVNMRTLAALEDPRLLELKGILQEMASTLQSLSHLQDANHSLLSERVATVRSELGMIRRGKTVNRAYFESGGPVEPRFLDRKS